MALRPLDLKFSRPEAFESTHALQHMLKLESDLLEMAANHLNVLVMPDESREFATTIVKALADSSKRIRGVLPEDVEAGTDDVHGVIALQHADLRARAPFWKRFLGLV